MLDCGTLVRMETHVLIVFIVTILGLVGGSFAGAMVWRLRVAQLTDDAKHGEKLKMSEKKQVSKLQGKPFHSDRSVCLHCGHELSWYDLVPIVSWASLKGRCRYCKKSIGFTEPLIELGLASFFIISYLFWPYELIGTVAVTQFILWLVAGVGMAVLFVYDAKWFLLPNAVVFPLIGLGSINAAVYIISNDFSQTSIVNVVLSCLILSGFYYLIYIVSQHKWVGFGDVKLGLALALFLCDWQLAILALFLANLIGTVILLPFIVTKNIKRQTHVPFGPLLIAGWAISGVFGIYIMDWYLSITLGL